MFRVLLASIKSLSLCPCPRCFVKKDQIGEMGTKLDARQCEDECVDNDARRKKIETTRGWIFEKGYSLASKAMQYLLAPTSLVPTWVRISAYSIPLYTNCHAECLFGTSLPIWFQFLFNVRCRPPPRIRAWCMEGSIYPSHENPVCCRR
jgi:hypothetical protein